MRCAKILTMDRGRESTTRDADAHDRAIFSRRGMVALERWNSVSFNRRRRRRTPAHTIATDTSQLIGASFRRWRDRRIA